MIEIDKPKYQKLRDYIIETINSGQVVVGDKIFSENELADKFDMSRNTVRQAIGELVNEGWLYRIQGKGTFVSGRPEIKPQKAKAVGVITTYLSDYIFPSIIKGIDNVLTENGYSLVLSCTYNMHDKERACLENLLNQNISGLIVEPTKSALPNPNIDLYNKFSDLGIPVLFIHGSYKELDCPYVVEDDTEAGYIATRHLIDLGHNKIGCIFKMDDIQGHYRFAGFQKAHKEAGLRISDSRTFWFETSEVDFKFKSYRGQLQNLLAECTAIVCYNDQISLKLLDFLRENDIKVPENLSIVSFDDSELAKASEVKLTTVAHPKETLGVEAAKAILSRIEGNQGSFELKLKPELVLRSSTQRLDEQLDSLND
jgi:GntR family transcriptional regulator of arabinose operon